MKEWIVVLDVKTDFRTVAATYTGDTPATGDTIEVHVLETPDIKFVEPVRATVFSFDEEKLPPVIYATYVSG